MFSNQTGSPPIERWCHSETQNSFYLRSPTSSNNNNNKDNEMLFNDHSANVQHPFTTFTTPMDYHRPQKGEIPDEDELELSFLDSDPSRLSIENTGDFRKDGVWNLMSEPAPDDMDHASSELDPRYQCRTQYIDDDVPAALPDFVSTFSECLRSGSIFCHSSASTTDILNRYYLTVPSPHDEDNAFLSELDRFPPSEKFIEEPVPIYHGQDEGMFYHNTQQETRLHSMESSHPLGDYPQHPGQTLQPFINRSRLQQSTGFLAHRTMTSQYGTTSPSMTSCYEQSIQMTPPSSPRISSLPPCVTPSVVEFQSANSGNSGFCGKKDWWKPGQEKSAASHKLVKLMINIISVT